MAATLFKRLISGDGIRKTRFHSYRGDPLDLAGYRFLPACLWSTALFKFGHQQPIPWLGYRARRRLNALIGPHWSVLEFGSGSSTRFFARRCQRMFSIESDPAWHARVAKSLAEGGFSNVDYRLLEREDYVNAAHVNDYSMDLSIVDGLYRDRAMVTAIRKTKAGGYVFLDNSDVQYEDHRAARQVLLDAAAPGSVWKFVDLYPFSVHVAESILVRLPA